jgi:general secretion pathway protein D
LDARRALSVGDLPRAQQFHAQAVQLKVVYDGPGDSPERIAESIHRSQELAQLRKSQPGGVAWRQQYAKFLLEQSQALVGWKDLETALRAANEAGQLDQQARVGGYTPQSLAEKIEQARTNGASLVLDAPSPQTAQPASQTKLETLRLLAASRAALRAGQLQQAEKMAAQASSLNVPDSQFGPGEDSPSRLAADLVKARMESSATQLASNAAPAKANPARRDAGVKPAELSLGVDQDQPALEQLPAARPLASTPASSGSDPFQLIEAGEAALKAGDRAAALEHFRSAYKQKDQLDLVMQQRLQGHLQMLSVSTGSAKPDPADGELIESAAAGQSLVATQLSADIGKRQSEAAKLKETDPNKAISLLAEARKLVAESELNDSLKQQLTRRIEMSLGEIERYVRDHKSELELEAANKAVLDEIERERVVKVEVQQRTAELVDKFNKLLDEQRFAEAEVVAKELYDMSPDELVAQQIWRQAKMIRRERFSREIDEKAENGVAGVFLDTRDTAADAADKFNTNFGYDATTWDHIKNRRTLTELGQGKQNAKHLEIEQKLRTPVLPRYDETPLSKVVDGLSQLAGVNIHLDPRGLSQEGVRTDTPVTLNLPQEISLKSALTLILEPLHLTYTVKDEVLKITSEQIRDGEVFIKTYPVGDLVVPIPNFVPNNNIGLQGLINDAYASMGYGAGGGTAGPVAVVAGARPGQKGIATPSSAMAQQFGAGNINGGGAGSIPFTSGGASGPGGLGGAANADFDSLIDLITSTVEHDSWMENGTGEGEIQPFPTNLSLVISQTQRVHEQIADLLEQLRRLQDLQVSIEVRFIRLSDNFFEKIGVDFDFNIEDRTGLTQTAGQVNSLTSPEAFEPIRKSATVGLQSAPPSGDNLPTFTSNFDLPFRQQSFNLAAPTIGTPQDVATFGFAILSDIEAYFLINASQGDRRSNTLQAPKVTLFNGQQAVVIDSAFVPFVISVIPVVGEFAAAQQPVIVVLSEGTMMTVQAVVSDDRRYVRLTLVPFFSQIGDVKEFTFEGSTTTQSSSNTTDDNNDGKNENDQQEDLVTRSGTTVQLPTFQVISVSTTVSVPDGGTVLLGGIKRLREERNELGVPLLSKVPYVDRLFRNVGIGRETNSLMMMVTPHIIIQEEEEERLGVSTD